MKSVIFTTFFAILLQESHQNLIWKVVTSSNLNPLLKLYFYSLILANNNMLLKTYCENIVVAFLNCHFFFFILFFLSFFPSSIHFFFFSLDFSPPHMYTHIYHPLPFCFFYFPLSRTSLCLSFFLQFSFSTFFFFIVIRIGEIGRERKNRWARWLRSTAAARRPLPLPLVFLPTQPRW